MKLHLDFETFSSEPIQDVGSYKYIESPDFEILLLCYAIDNGPIIEVDLAQGGKFPQEFIDLLFDPNVEIWAQNANFERNCLKAVGYDIPVTRFRCSAVKLAYCGLPLRLEDATKALQLGEKGKLSTGKALIRYFCVPVKPTKTNGNRYRNLPHHDPEKWAEFIKYCRYDVEAEREITRILSAYSIPDKELNLYFLDQKINDYGVMVDIDFTHKAIYLDNLHKSILHKRMQEVTGLENPNSPAQIKKWLSDATGDTIESIAKGELSDLLEVTGSGPVRELLELRQMAGKTSTKKYVAISGAVRDNGRVHGLLQFYGANRTGRWAGRLVQVQNLPQNHLDNLEIVRNLVATQTYETITMVYDDVSDVLSQMIRTAFIAPQGYTFAVNDFSAIEARVIAWLATEQWRLDVFSTHGKIYEASASMMFSIPIEEITKSNPVRQKGKIAELGLGFGGAVGALLTMGGDKMGLTEPEMKDIVYRWRQKSPRIVALWAAIERAAIESIKNRKTIVLKVFRDLEFDYDGLYLTIKLPSGRKLFYYKPVIDSNRWGAESIKFMGMDQVTKSWVRIDTYGGKLTENIVQAIARDLLAHSLLQLDAAGYKIVMHVHDEIVAEVPKDCAEDKLEEMRSIMSTPVDWAPGLPLESDGYITDFYKKD